MHSCYRCLLLLWSVNPFYSGVTRRNKLQYLFSISRIGSKQLCAADQNGNPVFVLFYTEVLPSLCEESHRNYTSSYEFLVALNKTPPAMRNLAFTIFHLASFSLGFPELEGHLILNPLGQCSSECWSDRVDCKATSGQLEGWFYSQDVSSECALRTRYAQLLSGIVDTFGRCCWTCFTIVEDVL